MKNVELKKILLGILLIVTACKNQHNETVVVDFSKTTTSENTTNQKDTVKPLRVAVAAMISPGETFIYYKELFDYISVKINRPVQFEQRKTYSEINEMLAKHQVDLAFVCSGAYIRNKKNCELLVIPIIHNLPYYRAYIIVNNSTSLYAFKELKGKTFAYTDPLSNTGKLYPDRRIKKLFRQSGKSFFSKTIYTHAHDISIQLVSKNVVDAASVDGLIYDYLKTKSPEKVKNIRVIEKSEYMGIPPVVTSMDIDKGLKKNLENIFLNIHNDSAGRVILNELMIDKFVVTDDTLYNTIGLHD